MIIDQLFEAPQQCPECGGISFSDLILAEKKDACYHKVKASAKVWPSAYASGRLVQCRKKGAANYGNKSEGVTEGMSGQVVFSGTGADGGTYEIIQSSPTDFMIHANGKHIDTYGSLQRAMSVLKNEVPGLQQGMAEEESEAAAQRKQYPSYYQHKDAGTVFRTQNDAGQRMDITPDDEEWDDYYKRQFPDMSTPNDEIPIRYNVDGTAVMVEVSLGDYGKKAPVSRAGAEIKKFFGRDDPAAVAAADRTIANRTKGLARADARRRPYTAPPVDKEKQRQQLTDKYPNIDQLVSRAEVNRDPNYEYADGQAYYDGQEAEQKYQQLKQIQRIIQGLNEETRQATVNTPVGDFTANITKDKSKNTVSGTMPVGGATLSATKDLTPGGAQSVSVDTNVAPNLNLSATRKSADYNKGQLAGTKSVSAKYTDTTGALGQPGQQHTATRTAGVGFGGASGPRVGKNYVTKIDKTLSDYMDEAKGITEQGKPPPGRPFDLPPLEGGGGGGGGGGYTGGPSPFKGLFGAKPGSREASIAQPTANTMTIRQGPNPDYVPPRTLQQKYDDLNKKLDQLPPPPPVKTPRPGRAAADKRQTDQAQAAELKDVVPLSPAERGRLRPVDANKVRQSEINKEPPDLSNVRPGRDYKQPSNWDDVRPGLDEQSRKKQPPEEKYGSEYDDMVARVKKLAGLGPMRTVYDPAKRVYRNVPTAQQPKK